MRWNIRVLKDEEVNYVFVNLRVLENAAVFREFSLGDEHHLVVSVGLKELKKQE